LVRNPAAGITLDLAPDLAAAAAAAAAVLLLLLPVCCLGFRKMSAYSMRAAAAGGRPCSCLRMSAGATAKQTVINVVLSWLPVYVIGIQTHAHMQK
jgi:ABC-type sulfate transport system permease component